MKVVSNAKCGVLDRRFQNELSECCRVRIMSLSSLVLTEFFWPPYGSVHATSPSGSSSGR